MFAGGQQVVLSQHSIPLLLMQVDVCVHSLCTTCVVTACDGILDIFAKGPLVIYEMLL